MKNILFPLAIILTHRRGAALALLKKIDEEQPFFIRVLGQTAENLLDAYCSLFNLAKLNLQDIKTLAVGAGPGSFTGLRLGCAFANGIKLGQNCQLISVKTELVSYFLSENYFNKEEDKQEFLNQLGEFDTNDESTGFVTFFDLLEAINNLKQNIYSCVDILEPHYGREPGPVIKLKGTKNGP